MVNSKVKGYFNSVKDSEWNLYNKMVNENPNAIIFAVTKFDTLTVFGDKTEKLSKLLKLTSGNGYATILPDALKDADIELIKNNIGNIFFISFENPSNYMLKEIERIQTLTKP